MAGTSAAHLEYHAVPFGYEAALTSLSRPIAAWFCTSIGIPTVCQAAAWPVLAAGKNLLLCAPTGTGKTLAAFTPVFDRFLTEPPSSGVCCLYITPLKALANDALKNLLTHLAGCCSSIKGWGRHSGLPVANACEPEHLSNCVGHSYEPTVALRTGDSSPKDRKKLLSKPPSILITTPESLAILLSQSMSQQLFAPLRWIVVDEIHCLAPNKRGADLSLSLERLTALAKQSIQRIGLSATCTPVDEVARLLVGQNGPCTIASIADSSPLQVHIEPLSMDVISTSDADNSLDALPDFIGTLVERLRTELEMYQSTLIFTNARGLAERLAWRLRRRFPDWDSVIAVHHSALAKERRRDVEERLKRGQLRAVVSSTSLELGIDIGSVDNVVLIHPPGAVARFLQRIGRSGHQPGRPRRGLILTANPAELLEATVTSACGRSVQYEAIRIPCHPLDVLCQHLVGLASSAAWQPDTAFELLRRAYPYRNLARSDFDSCLAYLSGKKSDGQDWLPPRLRWEDGSFSISDQFTARLLRRNLGTIIADELRSVCVQKSESESEPPYSREIGQIDDHYADHLKPGDRFLLDGRCLEFRKTDGWNLVVDEVIGRPVTPRWYGQGWSISAELARHLYHLRTRAGEALCEGPSGLVSLLGQEYGLKMKAIRPLVEYFSEQEAYSEIPDIKTLLVEVVSNESGADYYVHTPLNQPANQALAQVLVARLSRDFVVPASSVVADLGFVLSIERDDNLSSADFRSLLSSEGLVADLESALQQSELLRERFQCVATTGLMLLRQPLNGRRRVGGRDWGQRRLFDQIRAKDPLFVLLRQAIQEVATESCDVQAALGYLQYLPQLSIRCRRLKQPSPFAQHWTQVKPGANDAVANPTAALERLHTELMGQESFT